MAQEEKQTPALSPSLKRQNRKEKAAFFPIQWKSGEWKSESEQETGKQRIRNHISHMFVHKSRGSCRYVLERERERERERETERERAEESSSGLVAGHLPARILYVHVHSLHPQSVCLNHRLSIIEPRAMAGRAGLQRLDSGRRMLRDGLLFRFPSHGGHQRGEIHNNQRNQMCSRF